MDAFIAGMIQGLVACINTLFAISWAKRRRK